MLLKRILPHLFFIFLLTLLFLAGAFNVIGHQQLPTTTAVTATGIITFDSPNEVYVGEMFSVKVTFSGGNAQSDYYVKGLISNGATDSDWYGGNTLSADGINWLAWNGNWTEMPIINTDPQGKGNTEINLKTKDSLVPGEKLIKIRLQEVSSGINQDSVSTEISVLEPEEPTPTPIPEFTPMPTAEVEEPTPTPSPTILPTPTSTPTPISTISINFEVPQETHPEEIFQVNVKLTNGEADSTYYVKGLLGNDTDGIKLYNARTLSIDSETWLAWNAAWSKFPVLETNTIGEGSSTLHMKTNADTICGLNFIKIRARLVDSNVNLDSNLKEIQVTQLTATPIPTPTPTVSAIEPSSTSSESAVLTFTFGLPSAVKAEQEFEVPLALCGAQPQTDYYAKLLMGLTQENSLYSARTLGIDNEIWLAWNAAWSKFPVLTTSERGCGDLVIKARTKEDSAAGEYRVILRLKEVGKTKTYDSAERQLIVEATVAPTTQGQVLGTMGGLPVTGASIRELLYQIADIIK